VGEKIAGERVIDDGDGHLGRSYLDASTGVDDASSVRILIATVCLALASTACRSSANNIVRDDVTLIRQTRDGDGYPAGMGIGTLVVRGGRVALKGDTGPAAFVLWSAAADLRPSDVGFDVVDSDGSAAAIGTHVTIGGGFGDRDWAEGLVSELASSCAVDGHERYFIAAPGSLNKVPAP
jgi:hypothetical protein